MDVILGILFYIFYPVLKLGAYIATWVGIYLIFFKILIPLFIFLW